MKQISWFKILIGALIAGGLVFAGSFFNNKPSGIDYKELIKAKDDQIQLLMDERGIYERMNERLDNEIAEHKKQDSILVNQLTINRQNIKSIDAKLKDIPARISRIANNNDSLRVAITNL